MRHYEWPVTVTDDLRNAPNTGRAKRSPSTLDCYGFTRSNRNFNNGNYVLLIICRKHFHIVLYRINKYFFFVAFHI